jgi:hypothetical protein
VSLLVLPPARPGLYTLRLDLVEEGVAWFSDQGVTPVDLPYAVSTGAGASYRPATSYATIATGLPATLPVALTNTGTRPWIASGANPVRLSYHWLRDGALVEWDGARSSLAADVPPGANVVVSLLVVPPASPGLYLLRVDLVEEGVGWFSDEAVPTVNVVYVAYQMNGGN